MPLQRLLFILYCTNYQSEEAGRSVHPHTMGMLMPQIFSTILYLCRQNIYRLTPNNMSKSSGFVTDGKGHNYLVPFILITTLFFLWGFAHSFLDVLNKHFQNTLNASKTESALVQFMVYGGYFLMALPAGYIIRRAGYRAGVLTGLVLYAVGAFLFVPGGQMGSFAFYLVALFIIGCGLTCLETAANPYATVLGDPSQAERRINVAQSLNGLGWIIGPFVGGLFLFGDQSETGYDLGFTTLPAITIPYAAIGLLVILVAMVFAFVRLPQVDNSNASTDEQAHTDLPLLQQPRFLFGLLALFLYVAAQTGINSFFINYATEHSELSDTAATFVLSFGCMALFLIGRLGGSFVMARVRGERVLAICAVGAIVGCAVAMAVPNTIGMGALLLVYLCESIMFPTIFALSIRGLGGRTEQASSLLIMSIVGGAFAPLLMGFLADTFSTAVGFIVPLVCFVVIFAFGATYKR